MNSKQVVEYIEQKAAKAGLFHTSTTPINQDAVVIVIRSHDPTKAHKVAAVTISGLEMMQNSTLTMAEHLLNDKFDAAIRSLEAA